MNTIRWAAMASPFLLCALSACTANVGDDEETVSEGAALSTNAHDAVFTMSNSAQGNTVIAFQRTPSGLVPAGETATGGLGTSAGLGSQGALALSADGRYLLAVNAGSNEVSCFEVDGTTLTLKSHASSGGVQPVSVTVHEHLVYVVNAGGTANVSGLRIGKDGSLTPIPGSTRALSVGAPGPGQIELTPDASTVVVSEKGTNLIDTFARRDDGSLGELHTHASSGATPFGFEMTSHGRLVVSEAAGGRAGAGTVSSYKLGDEQALDVVTASAPDLQTAPCWVAITKDGKYAYTANAGSGSISGYSMDPKGNLALLDATGVTLATGAGSRPLDMAFDVSSQHLYVLAGGLHGIVEASVAADGSLTLGTTAGGLPATAVGLVAR